MRELRAVALSEDGDHVVLADPTGSPDGERYRVAVDDRLRAALRDRPRNRPEDRRESALAPREIQARLRAGESAADVARVAGISVERVERYEGPVMAERNRVVMEARAALLPKDTTGVPGRPLGDVVDARLSTAGDDPEAAEWDAWRRPDGIWLVQLTSESRCARWTWDPVVRRVRPHDDAARALVGAEPPADQSASAPPAPAPGPAAAARPAAPALTLVSEPVPASGAPAPRPAPASSPAPAARPAQRPTAGSAGPAEPAESTEPGGPAGPPAAQPAARAASGRRVRKPVPSWDDIVFGARRP